MAGSEAVAVLGAGGTMGFPIARNLARAGIGVRAWSRTPARAEPLAADGARIAGSPEQAAEGAGIVLTMLPDAGTVIAAMTGGDGAGALPAVAGRGIWLQMSTIGEAGTGQCARLAAGHGVSFIDAPVLGSRQPAEEGSLVVLASGPEALRETVEPVFGAIGRKTMWVGQAGAGTRLKLVTNSWVLAVMEAGAETLALADGLGLDPSLFFEAIGGGTLDLPYLRIKARAIGEQDFTPSFRLKLAAKDAGLIRDAAASHGLDLPVLAAIGQRLSEGAREHGDKDMAATYLTSAPPRAA
jgi:3-hydroxyisobutyrate dehydrogenase